jgi:hypothetical protein
MTTEQISETADSCRGVGSEWQCAFGRYASTRGGAPGGKSRSVQRGFRRLMLNLLTAVPVLIAAWLVILAVVLRAGAEGSAVLVLFPPDSFVGGIEDAAITNISPISVTLRSDRPGLAARAYDAGAWLVFPAGLESCISVSGDGARL